MAVRHGYGKIAGADALVFAYDTGDTRNSYIGEPATNLALFSMNAGFSSDYPSNITFTDDSTVTYQGRQSKRVVATGQWNIYKYPRSGNYTATSSTTFTYSFKIKWSDGHTPYFSNGYIYTDAIATYPGITIRAIEDGWFWCYCTYNTTSSPPTLTGFTTTDTGTCWIVDWQLEAGRLHPTPYVAPGGTRSSTQGLLDLNGRSTPDLTNVSFDSNAQMFFDGTNDNVTAANNSSINVTGAEITLEAIFKPDSFGAAEAIIHKDVQYTLAFYPNGEQGTVTYADSSLWSYSTFGFHGVFLTGEYYHVVVTKKNGVVNIYSNSEIVVSKGFGGSITSTSNPLYIGSYSDSYYSHGVLPVTKIYTRALTADEVRNNYNQYRTRFNI
jgi:hypothetical protein